MVRADVVEKNVRNRIAHGYASVDHDRIHAEATAGIEALRRFMLAAAAAAGANDE
jgi:uncharacterized protein with HEPN domain